MTKRHSSQRKIQKKTRITTAGEKNTLGQDEKRSNGTTDRHPPDPDKDSSLINRGAR
jgi:hypothetical protein